MSTTFLSVFDHFVGLALKGLTMNDVNSYEMEGNEI